MDWPQNKPLSNWNYQSHHLLGLRFIGTCNIYGSRNKWARSKTICVDITIKMLYQFWMQCKKVLHFTTTKIPIRCFLVVHYQTWPTFVYTKLQRQNVVPFTDGDKTNLEKKWEDVVSGSSIVFTRKAVLDETFFENPQTYANQLSGLIPANYTPTLFLSRCLRFHVGVGVTIQKPIDSYLVRTINVALEIWSSPIFNEQDQNVKSKASMMKVDERKLIVSVLMDCSLIATLCSK